MFETRISDLSFEEKARLLTGGSDMQTFSMEEKNISSLSFADGPHGIRREENANCTHFPNLCNLGSSWNTDTAYLMGQALAKDCIHHNVDMLLGPGINIKRHILCGRNFEYLSEDPVLAGELASGYVNGLQELGVKACVKHFAANNQEVDRACVSVEIDERTLREIYLKAFEMVVKKANPASVMCAYNKLNGILCSENRYLLNDVLRDEWNYDGMVVSDWCAVHDISRAVRAGLDLQMPKNAKIVEQLQAGVESGKIDVQTIDKAVLRMLKFTAKTEKQQISYDRDEQHEIARKVAADGMVLLKNDHAVLPITAKKYKKVAVIGEYAVSPLISGFGSAEVHQQKEFTDSPLEELKKRLPDVEFKYFEIYKKSEHPREMMWPMSGKLRGDVSDCDLVLFFAGSMQSEDTEFFDRQSATLDPNINFFIDTIKRTNKPVAVVLQNGGALILDKWASKVDSILEMWLAGESAGGAVADILCGNVNPSGKLSETFPKKMRGDLDYPGDGYKVEYKERFAVGYRYYDQHTDEILFPFGHGLSYSDFEYSNLSLNTDEDGVTIEFDLKNIGEVEGAEVVQLYVGDPISTVVKPLKELKKFKKINLEAGQTEHVCLTLDYSEIAYFNAALREFVVENGKYEIYVGSSSQDIRLFGSFMYACENAPYTVNYIAETMIG